LMAMRPPLRSSHFIRSAAECKPEPGQRDVDKILQRAYIECVGDVWISNERIDP